MSLITNDRCRGPGWDALRRRWSRWTAIVEAFALRRPARNRVDPAAYRVLHQELIAACRALADSDDGGRRGLPGALEVLVGPWLDPRTLAQADREILEGLLARCRRIERELGGRAGPPAALVRCIGALPPALALAGKVSLLALALVGLVSLLRTAGVDPISTLDRVAGWANAIWLSAQRASDIQRLGALAILIIPAALILVRRTARS